ncbi:PSP1 C-terminal conserved region-domain-containing protein [Gongronella butleri]|nr:PSP1 C-terminal conserved region-domain-containing protein [Gongronella butleri]
MLAMNNASESDEAPAASKAQLPWQQHPLDQRYGAFQPWTSPMASPPPWNPSSSSLFHDDTAPPPPPSLRRHSEWHAYTTNSLYAMPEDDPLDVPPAMNSFLTDMDDDSDFFQRARSKSSAPAFDWPNNNHRWFSPFLPSDTLHLNAPRRFSVQPALQPHQFHQNHTNYASDAAPIPSHPLMPLKDSTSDSLVAFSRRHSVAGPAAPLAQDDAFNLRTLESSIDELTKIPPSPLGSGRAAPSMTTAMPTTFATATTSPHHHVPQPPKKDYAKVAAAAAASAAANSTPSNTAPKSINDTIDHLAITSPPHSMHTLPAAPMHHHPLHRIAPRPTVSNSSSSSSSSNAPFYHLPKCEEMGKGNKLDSIAKDAVFAVVRFKSNRTDLFYCAHASVVVKVNDWVMVEGDRGHDLGRVIADHVNPIQHHLQQQQQQQQQQTSPNASQQKQQQPTSSSSSSSLSSSSDQQDVEQVRQQLRVKRLFRVARPEELALLASKEQDEIKALATCQYKVQQRKLSIRVVNAEYQWDRRKLTFYFLADRRVDFRELVRELFKLYKTRIWMQVLLDMGKKKSAIGSSFHFFSFFFLGAT